MKKINFVFKNASKQTRIMGIVALGLAALAILMLIVGTCSAIYGPLADVPVVELLGEAVPELDLDNLDDYVDEIKDAIEEEDDDLIDEIEDELGMSADEFLDYLDPLSLNSMKVMTDKMADFFDADNTFGIVISAVIGFISGYAILLGLFVALSALFMNKGWFIASAVISPLFFFAFVGFFWFFVFLGLCIAYSILVSKVHNEYIIYNHNNTQSAPEAPVAAEDSAV